MNKLYVIRFLLSNSFCISVWYAWDRADVLKKMADNPEWTYELVEDFDIHAVWNAR